MLNLSFTTTNDTLQLAKTISVLIFLFTHNWIYQFSEKIRPNYTLNEDVNSICMWEAVGATLGTECITACKKRRNGCKKQ